MTTTRSSTTRAADRKSRTPLEPVTHDAAGRDDRQGEPPKTKEGDEPVLVREVIAFTEEMLPP